MTRVVTMWRDQLYVLFALVCLACAQCPLTWFRLQYTNCVNEFPLLNGTDTSKFLQKMLTLTDHDRLSSTCGMYKLMKMCMEHCLRICPDQRPAHEKRFQLSDNIMTVLCDNSGGYSQNVWCIAGQRGGLLSRRCDKIYGLRKLSGSSSTDPKYDCSLLEDLFLCKDRLIRSACGHAAADATFKLNSIIYQRRIEANKCELTVDKTSDAFQYSTPCPPTFPVGLAACTDTFMRVAPSVYSHLPVVINGNASAVDRMCSAQIEYQGCISSIVQACPAGTKYIEDTFHWNVKHELASYMCSQKEAYKRHLDCYKTLVKLQIRDQKRSCLETRHQTVLLLKNYYLYACNRTARHDVSYMKKKTDELITCLTDLTKDHCGTEASSIIKPLLQTKFGLGQFRMRCDGTVLDLTVPAQRNDRAHQKADIEVSDSTAGNSASKFSPSLLIVVIFYLLLT